MANKERTEKATERRRKKASDDGQFAYSQQLTSAMTLAVCIPTVFYYLHSPAGFRSFFASILQDVTSSRNPELILGNIIRRTGIYFLMIAAPVFAAALLSVLAGNVLQGLPKSGKLKLKFDRLNPIQGLSRLQTKAEVKEDMKALEGNPQIKGKIKSIQREAARRRMMSRVKDADVIVTNPTHYAVALEYKPDKMAAPRVIAKGRNWIAQRIKQLGREHDIPTVENKPLARALYRSVKIEQEIPMELYKAVAEVLAYVFKIRNRS